MRYWNFITAPIILGISCVIVSGLLTWGLVSIANASPTKVNVEPYAIMTLKYLNKDGYPTQNQVTIDPESCQWIKFQAEHNWKGLEVSCVNYINV